MENKTATEIAMRRIEKPNLRRLRADMFTSAVFAEIEDLIVGDLKDEVHARLRKLFYDNGASIMTDEDRAREGFEPRDANGWTPSERVERERERLDLMQMMASAVYFSPPKA